MIFKLDEADKENSGMGTPIKGERQPWANANKK